MPGGKGSKQAPRENTNDTDSGNKKDADEIVRELNWKLTGWRNYFNAPGTYPRNTFRKVNWYLRQRISQFYSRKSQRRSRLYGHRAYERLTKSGLVIL
ncbi:MAG: hypothetical protein EHM72_12270 [Calditrichaeota bacterium]|nr:MAG: hypothetical protein EHM72_12270 [Calditrichota bacterium]